MLTELDLRVVSLLLDLLWIDVGWLVADLEMWIDLGWLVTEL